MDSLDLLFVVVAFLFQVVMIIHFALRKYRFETAIRYGPAIYALSIPAAGASLFLLSAGKPWSVWVAGFLYLIWAAYGYTTEYLRKIQWRTPFRWSVGVPYLILYLATTMFYWFPLGILSKPLWYVYAVFFAATTYLNVTSHHPAETRGRQAIS